VLPQWGDKPARKITSDDVTELLEAILWRVALNTWAAKLRTILEPNDDATAVPFKAAR